MRQLQLQLLLCLAAATVRSYYVAPPSNLRFRDLADMPDMVEGPPEYEMVEIRPEQLEEAHNPAMDQLRFPADYFELNREPNYVDYFDTPLEYVQNQDDFYGQNVNVENLRGLMKETDNRNIELTQNLPSTSKMTTSRTTESQPETRMTKERRGMVEVPILRPEEARDPKFMFRG